MLRTRHLPAIFTVSRLVVGVTAVLLVGCAPPFSQKNAELNQAQACSMLKRVMSQAGDGFRSLRGTGSTDYDYTRWDAKPIADGTDCDILSWGGDRINYACTWNKGSEAVAKSDYKDGLSLVRKCLGPDWQVSHPPGQSGEATLFSQTGDPTKIDVRYYKERDPSTNWQTSLTIGPPVTRDAR
jgi:hypothetical protein